MEGRPRAELKLSQALCIADEAAARCSSAQKGRRGEDTQDPSGSPKENKQPPYYFFRFCIGEEKKEEVIKKTTLISKLILVNNWPTTQLRLK